MQLLFILFLNLIWVLQHGPREYFIRARQKKSSGSEASIR